MKEADFSQIKSDAEILNAFNAGTGESNKTGEIFNTNIFAFKTAQGKVGLLLINDYTPSETGSVTFSVKVIK